MGSTDSYTSHSELTRQKPKGRISKKARTLDTKIQIQISPPHRKYS